MKIDWNDLPTWLVLGGVGLAFAGVLLGIMIGEQRVGRLPKLEEFPLSPVGAEVTEEGCLFAAFLCIASGVYLNSQHHLAWWWAVPAGLLLGVLLAGALYVLTMLYLRVIVFLIRKTCERGQQG